MSGVPLITFDVDWAPDAAIDAVAELLVDARVAATWFVTHASPAVDRLREHPELFELGIHPNFLAGSTHGATPEAVLEHCMSLVPEARSMRTHGLVQSSALLALVRSTTPIAVDASLFLPYAPAIAPVRYPMPVGELVRVPYYWEDDAEMYRPRPVWDLDRILGTATGLTVLNFHPIHAYLNSRDMSAYGEAKAMGRPLQELTAGDLAPLRREGPGAGAVLAAAVERLAEAGGGHKLSDEAARA